MGDVSETGEPGNLPSVSLERPSSVSTVTPTKRTHGIFSEESVADIKTIFSDMIINNKPISKVEIEKRCSKSKEGKLLLENLRVKQLINCINTNV